MACADGVKSIDEGSIIVFVFKSIFSWAESLLFGARRMWTVLRLLAAVALAIASGVGSFFVPTKLLGVLVAAFGCFTAGWLFSSTLAKLVRLRPKDVETCESLQDELKKRESEIRDLESAVNDLRADKERLEKQRIDINTIMPVFKLGLMDAQMSITDVDIGRWMNDFEESGIFSSAKRSQYIGVLRRSFKATYGVDLSKLRVMEAPDCLRIVGITPESLGFKDVKTEWLVRQIQTYSLKPTSETCGGAMPVANNATGFKHLDEYYEIDRKVPFTGTLDRDQTAELCERQERVLSDRLNNGIGEEFSHVNEYIGNMAKGVIQILLSPVGKRVDFVDLPFSQAEKESGWLALEDFVNGFNRRLDSAPAVNGLLEGRAS